MEFNVGLGIFYCVNTQKVKKNNNPDFYYQYQNFIISVVNRLVIGNSINFGGGYSFPCPFIIYSICMEKKKQALH